MNEENDKSANRLFYQPFTLSPIFNEINSFCKKSQEQTSQCASKFNSNFDFNFNIKVEPKFDETAKPLFSKENNFFDEITGDKEVIKINSSLTKKKRKINNLEMDLVQISNFDFVNNNSSKNKKVFEIRKIEKKEKIKTYDIITFDDILKRNNHLLKYLKKIDNLKQPIFHNYFSSSKDISKKIEFVKSYSESKAIDSDYYEHIGFMMNQNKNFESNIKRKNVFNINPKVNKSKVDQLMIEEFNSEEEDLVQSPSSSFNTKFELNFGANPLSLYEYFKQKFQKESNNFNLLKYLVLEINQLPLIKKTYRTIKKKKKLFKCSLCNKQFVKSQALGGHFSKKHSFQSSKFQKKQEIRDMRNSYRERIFRAKELFFKERSQNYSDLLKSKQNIFIRNEIRENLSEYKKILKKI